MAYRSTLTYGGPTEPPEKSQASNQAVKGSGRRARIADKPRPPVEQMPLSKISREVLRVECRRCSRCVEIQRLDAIRLYGPMAVWKDVGRRLLDDGCRIRTGRHEEDGCWPDFSSKWKLRHVVTPRL
jgi:hypothetical protein